MKVLSVFAAVSALFVFEPFSAAASPKVHADQHLRSKQECIDLAHSRGFDRSQGQHGTANSGMNQFIHDCRRGLVK